MALATRCPHCHTTFRVAHDQLKLRGGIVRCGQCRQVFNGIEHLLPPAGIQPAANPGVPPKDDLSHVDRLIPPAAVGNQVEIGLPSRVDSEPDAAAPQPKLTEPANILDELDYAALEGMTLMHFPPADQPEQPDESAPAAGVAADNPSLTEHNTAPTEKTSAARFETRIEPGLTAALPAAEPDFAPQAEEYPQDEPGFIAAARRRQHREPRSRLLFGIGSTILALTLLAQAAYALRHQIAAHLPQTRPALLAVCRTLGCSITLPARIDAISIESSELQTQPGTAGTLTLTLLLRNRSSTAQAWPDMELTLNDGNEDGNERPILRRIFTPREFPLGATEIANGFAANSEQSVRLTFALTQLKAAGYRVILFYP
ncbi:DUF3426 domain-containing protein [Herminiimonas sp. CN]|uniref:DUF3426 domain-containing protein n=1 Tax=Herminiimonas sp. CN TaxID=1349818 RepID=UPI0004735D96|nr:DUF3426 domain-containing protein [Herminiimonas sp. CN]